MTLIKLEDLQIATSDIADHLTLTDIQGGSDKDSKCYSYCGNYGHGKGKEEHEYEYEYEYEEKEKNHKGKYECDD
jgi:hypothetical protein